MKKEIVWVPACLWIRKNNKNSKKIICVMMNAQLLNKCLVVKKSCHILLNCYIKIKIKNLMYWHFFDKFLIFLRSYKASHINITSSIS